ncbi:MBL fold metallo-hydrolase [Celeribacter neptunius]|uniref:Glyoxylase, beta-lactamase superfamily II n=1 Tax=Celeribacter neptunius TaxID=588602 RepID=A0A1I3KJR0_9RHOB|nr:MBL fold metallo-hydrolase [Celeribacter neptunius]SFI72435.1 Glyoxylase, beta-lactamase superfamily II [Celeribacter neptunius]
MKPTLMVALAVALPVALPGLAAADVLTVEPVAEDVYALVGPLTQRDPVNLGNNATFGVVVTSEGVVLVDAGGSWLGAQMIDDVIDTITDQPVTYVIDTGGQDHRWIGNSYWQAQGATVIASQAAVEDQQARASMEMTMLSQLVGEGLKGTDPAFADVTFESDYTLDLGGITLQIMHRGQAHTPGDSFVWLKDRDVMFTGDIVFTDRMLGVLPDSNVKSWLGAFEAMAEFDPAQIVPGHGPVADLSKARAESYDYLLNLRTEIGALIDAGGDIMAAPTIDQSRWADLPQFDALAGRNAQATFEQMEWE